MGEPVYVNLNIQTENIIPVAQRSTGNVGIVGYSEVLKASPGTIGEYTDIQQIRTVYGAQSGLARSAALAIQNGANPVIVVNCAASDVDNNEGGTPGPASFAIDATEVSLVGTDPIAVGSLVVASPTLAAPTKTYVEGPNPEAGDEYYVDYGNRIIYFYSSTSVVAGEAGYDIIDETAGDLTAALAALANAKVQLVVFAYMFGGTPISGSVDSMATHIDATAATVLRKRIGIVANAHGTATTTLKTTIEGAMTSVDRIALFHHKSYSDVAAIVAGAVSQLLPQQSLQMKQVLQTLITDNFTDTEYDTFKTNQINSIVNSDFTPANYISIDGGFTLSTTSFTKFVDSVRVIDDSSFKIQAALTTPTIIGEIDLATVRGMNTLRGTLNAVLSKMKNEREISGYTYSIPLENTVRTPTADRSSEQQAELASAVANRKFGADIEITYSGAVHELDPVNIAYSGV